MRLSISLFRLMLVNVYCKKEIYDFDVKRLKLSYFLTSEMSKKNTIFVAHK